MSKRTSGGVRRARMARNTDLCDGCRTVFLPTLDEFFKWWKANCERYPVMGYFCFGTPLLVAPQDGNDECEWIVGPTVETVVGKMLTHLGMSTTPEWREDTVEEAGFPCGRWELGDVRACPELGDAACLASFSDKSVGPEAAAARMLRSIAEGDQYDIRIWEGSSVNRLISSELANKLSDGVDYYGFQNEDHS
jgi:hypothetical protein